MSTDKMMISVYLENEASTVALGEKIGILLRAGDVIALRGSLGAGKTTLVRGISHSLGYSKGAASPTFNIVFTYPTNPPLVHIDAYRFRSKHEFADSGCDDLMDRDSITIIEWPERIGDYLPKECLEIHLSHSNAGRDLEITLRGEWLRRSEHFENLVAKR